MEAGCRADKELFLGVKTQRQEQDHTAQMVVQTQMPVVPGGTRTLSWYPEGTGVVWKGCSIWPCYRQELLKVH